MHTDPRFTLAGYIINRNTGQGVADLRVEAWDKDFIFHDFLGITYTDSRGHFHLNFNDAQFSDFGLERRPDVFFRIFDGTVVLKNTIHELVCTLDPGQHTVKIHLDLPAENGESPPPTVPFSGPLIEPEELFVFKQALSKTLASLGSRYTADDLKELRIPFDGVSNLLDLASATVSGDQQQGKRLREMLWSYGGKVVPTQLGWRVLRQYQNGRYAGESSRRGRKKVATPSLPKDSPPGLINLLRLEQLMIAAAVSARSTGELASLAASLEHALAAADQLNTLYGLMVKQADPTEVADAFDTAVRISSFAFPPMNGFTPGEGWQPGMGFGPGFGGPWYEWPMPTPGEPFPLPDSPDPAVPVPEVPRLEGGLVEHFEECFIFSIIPEIHRLGIGFRDLVYGVGTHYAIDRVSPSHACPGEQITIAGERFDGVVAVRYKNHRGRTISTTPDSATSERITFTLAEDAVSGPVWLDIPRRVRLCLTEHTVAIPGERGELIVGAPHVVSFSAGRDCLPRGETITLNWRVSPSAVDVEIIHRFRGAVTSLGSGLGAVDSVAFTPSRTGIHEFELAAINPLGRGCNTGGQVISVEVRDPAPPPFEIVGVEQTQAIQIYDLADPTAPTNNSLELIRGMDTVLRVYVRALSPAPTRVTGSMELSGNTYSPINADFIGPNPIITAPETPDRTDTNHSLNFLIPAADARGRGVTAHIRVISATNPCYNPVRYRAEMLHWHGRAAFPVTVRRVANSDGTQMSLPNATAFINRAFFKIPSPKTAITFHPGVHQIRRGTTEDNYCHDGGFYQLALSIAYEHNDNEGYPPASHSSTWIGLVTPFDCTPDGMMAWPSTSTCLSIQDVTTAAHEIMHTVGLGHTVTGEGEGCWDGPALTGGADTQPVPCHRLPGRPTGQLNQVPFDIAGNRAVRRAFDLMSYRGWNNRWLSPELWVEGRTMMNSRY
ncbi:hypothetical protein GGR26_002686 [Lewinella marina]|uniref:Uncharacterized protein n=1 Tax=Neolewinella marina TaxID=438751 RepID=A0A2G0CD36_9BACT|nr:hypothetical protein [Neolewinella marina]NJB86909.1 hypothetical protein [Neolewinella marina]PHK97893.1 hypothetical protein CGL56_13855 [Neolewinella marina]